MVHWQKNLVNVQEQLKVKKVLMLPRGTALKPMALICTPLHTQYIRSPSPKKQGQFEYGRVLTCCKLLLVLCIHKCSTW